MHKISSAKLLGIVAVLALIAWALLQIPMPPAAPAVASYDDCAKAGYPIRESYPAQCSTPDGKVFIQEVSNPPMPFEPAPSATSTAGAGCMIGGCSAELCVAAGDEGNAMSNCIYKPEFACYKRAKCEMQPNGQCGWTQTPEFFACVQEARSSDQQPGTLPM